MAPSTANSATPRGRRCASSSSLRRCDAGRLSLDAVKAVRAFDKRVCRLVCQAGERADGERCVRVGCPSGQVLKDGACVAERASSPAARPAPAPKGGGGKCFTFQGRQYCE